MTDEFDKDFYMKTLRTARDLGMMVLPKRKCAMLMAILMVFGNNEGFTLSPKFQCEREFIQETYGIDGGKTPSDTEFLEMFREYVKAYEAVESDNDPLFIDASNFIMQRYNFKLIC